MSGGIRNRVAASEGRAEMDIGSGACSRRRQVIALCGVMAAAAALLAVAFAASAQAHAFPEEFSLLPTEALLSSDQAGAHADFESRWTFEGDPTRKSACWLTTAPGCHQVPWANFRDVAVDTPPGLIGNQSLFPTCDAQTFIEQVSFSGNPKYCPSDTQVGLISPGTAGFLDFFPGEFYEPLYNLEAPGGESGVVARFGFVALLFPVFIDVRLDPKRGYSLSTTLVNSPELSAVTGSYNRFWGVPTDSSHDHQRYNWLEAILCNEHCGGTGVPSGLPPTPLMSNPTNCSAVEEVETSADTYDRPEGFALDVAPVDSGEITGCASVPFEPTMSVKPTTRSAGVPSGLDVGLEIPQPGLLNPRGRATAHLKTSAVTLPQGFTLNASAVDGLGSCSEEQVGVDTGERQVVNYTSHGSPVSLSFDGQSTRLLPSFATASEVQAALEALPNVGTGGVSVSGRIGGPWTVDFGGALKGKDVPTIAGLNSEVQRVTTNSIGGTYTLGFQGEETEPLSYEATADEVQSALEALPTVGAGQVAVTGGKTTVGERAGKAFRVVFGGELAEEDVPQLTADKSGLLEQEHEPAFREYEAYANVETLIDGGPTVTTHVVADGGALRFTGANPTCPESSKIASGELATPLFKQPLHTDFYLAKQADNPFNSLFAGYLVAKGNGALIKVPARIDIDPETGQIVTTFEQNPQQPFSDLTLHFKSGNRGLITTPVECGTYQSTYELTPWTGQPAITGKSKFTLDENCQHGFNPSFSAGSESPLAGAFTSFITRVTRDSGEPFLRSLSIDLPPGLSAKLAGVPYCPDSILSGISTATGAGAAQLGSPSCPAASQVGTVTAGIGSGAPFYVNGGRVYLAGPYRGAPLSLAVLVPAVAGPFDLGNVVVRVGVSLNPVTAQVHAVSDPLPTMLHGVPIDLRELRVNLDRPAFVLNPTGCRPEAVTATIEGAGGVTMNASDRFQIGECAALGLKPKMSLRLKGGTTRAKHPALTVILRPREGDANLESTSVTFPKSELLDQSHLGNVCTRVQWAAEQCPPASIYGTVTATTPLLDNPLSGNIYLRSSSHTLPDLVLDLRGPASQPIKLEASGRTDSVHGRLRNTFEFIPDAPLSKVVLHLDGGKKGLLQNKTNICARPYRAAVEFIGHNGRRYGTAPKVIASCHGKHGHGKHKRRHGS